MMAQIRVGDHSADSFALISFLTDLAILHAQLFRSVLSICLSDMTDAVSAVTAEKPKYVLKLQKKECS